MEQLWGAETPQCTERAWNVHGGSGSTDGPGSVERLRAEGPPSTRSGSEVLGASQRMGRLRDARIPQYRVALGCRDSPKHQEATGCAESPSAWTDPGMHGAVLGCRDTPEHGWTVRFMEQLRVQGQALGCWDPAMHRGAQNVGYTESLVHGWTLGCTEQLWGARTPQNTGVHGQTQGCVRQLQLQGQAVWNGDVLNFQSMNGLARTPAVHRAAPRSVDSVGTLGIPSPGA